MAKARIGHITEARILEALEIDYIDESEVLTMADEEVSQYRMLCSKLYTNDVNLYQHHINKTKFKVPFVCGCRNIGEALRRIAEGAAMIRTKGEAGTGNVVEAVRHARSVQRDIKRLTVMDEDELYVFAKDHGVPINLVQEVARTGKLPVVNFAAGGVATPADAALMMELGMDGVFVGSGIFMSGDPVKRARAIVLAVTHYKDYKKLAELSENLGKPMTGVSDLHKDPVNFRARDS